MMTGTKFDIEKFDGKNDFGLWQVRMKAFLEQQGLAAALEESPATMISQSVHIDEFHKLVGDLAAINVVISDEVDQALLLLMSLLSSYNNFMDTLLYDRDTLNLEDMLATLNFREEAVDSGVIYVSGSRADGYDNADVMTVYVGGNILLGDGKECRVRGTELRRNMISLGTLEKKGFTVKMQSDKIKVIKGSLIKTGNVLDSSNHRFTQQCTKSEVVRHLGVAGIQQQNDLVEETHVTLLAKVRCFLIQSGLSKVFWAEDTTMSTYLVNKSPSSAIEIKTPVDMIMGFNKSGEYKKTFIGFSVARDREQHLAWELFSYREYNNEATFAVDVVDKVLHRSHSLSIIQLLVRKCSDDGNGYYSEIWATKGLLDKVKGNILGMKIVRDQSGNTLRVSAQVLQREVGTNFVGGTLCMLVKFDRGLQTYVKVFVDFDYAIGRSITVMTGYMTLTKAIKEDIWINGHLTESRAKLMSAVIFATGFLLKAIPVPRFPQWLKLLCIVED
ncbi:zinc finger, CCHC-type containing protein [Tanacetum coccineum]|uniref:Zinc finger, CCHC-type containing protein n=1 Tax=Tanacetum coccineum TaxID=301880 RepID=A0ABQ4YER1_9ASTR